MQPRIETITEKKLIGKHLSMSMARDMTYELWRSFMPRRKEITNAVNTDLISMTIYNAGLNFNDFTPDTKFEKWAAVEVSDYDVVPEGLEKCILASGLYAVFLYQGAANAFAPAFDYIFKTWLPASAYLLDSRPHFFVMGEKYKGNDPASEEEVWIPIKGR